MSTQLIYRGLPLRIDEAFIQQTLLAGYNVQRVDLKESHNKKNKYAFVTFDTPSNAESAMKETKYIKLDHYPIIVQPCDPETKRIIKEANCTLFIKNLATDISVDELDEAFGNYGEVISCHIRLEPVLDEKGQLEGYKSLGQGFVTFRNKKDAEKARDELNDANINGQQIAIDWYLPKKQREEQRKNDWTNVYVKNLCRKHFKSEDDLKKEFKLVDSNENASDNVFKYQSIKFKEITDEMAEQLMRKNPNFTDTTYAQINFTDHKDAIRFIEQHNTSEVHGYTLYVARSLSKKEKAQVAEEERRARQMDLFRNRFNRNFYIRWDNEFITKDDIREFFEEAARKITADGFTIEIEEVVVPKNKFSEGDATYGYLTIKHPNPEANERLKDLSAELAELKREADSTPEQQEPRIKELNEHIDQIKKEFSPILSKIPIHIEKYTLEYKIQKKVNGKEINQQIFVVLYKPKDMRVSQKSQAPAQDERKEKKISEILCEDIIAQSEEYIGFKLEDRRRVQIELRKYSPEQQRILAEDQTALRDWCKKTFEKKN